METKVCGKCGEERPTKKFSRNKEKKDGLNSTCKICHREYTKAHYANNRQKYIDRAKANRVKEKEKTAKLLFELKSSGCLRCGEKHPACLHFHHRDPSTKEENVSLLKNSRSRIIGEAKKCDILCANCHAKEHYSGDYVGDVG